MARRWWAKCSPTAFVLAWETAHSNEDVCRRVGVKDASLRADFLRGLGVPLTRFAQGKLRAGEPRRIAWGTPLSVAELMRLAAFAFLLGERVPDPIVEEVRREGLAVPQEQQEEVRVSADRMSRALAEEMERLKQTKERKLERRRARRAAAVASGLRARDVN